MNRSFLLPLSALALGFNACSGDDPDTDTSDGTEPDTEVDTELDTELDTEAEPTFRGLWNLTSVTDIADNETDTFPQIDIEDVEEYDNSTGDYQPTGETRTTVYSIALLVEMGTVAFTTTETETSTENPGFSTSYSATYDGIWSEVPGPIYRVRISDELEMDCTLDTDSIACESSNRGPGDEIQLTFDRDVPAE